MPGPPKGVTFTEEHCRKLSEAARNKPEVSRAPKKYVNRTRLSSDAKCNTPRRFDIGKVVQDLKECCHAILCASVGGRKRPDRRFAGRGLARGLDQAASIAR